MKTLYVEKQGSKWILTDANNSIFVDKFFSTAQSAHNYARRLGYNSTEFQS